MKVSAFDLNHARALHYLLEEAHVGRAAERLGITPAAASNSLRRLRAEFDDPLLVRSGRGVVRSRGGESLRAAARDVVESAERLLHLANPFAPSTFSGHLTIAMAEHVATVLLPRLDRLCSEQAPAATLELTRVPSRFVDWLESSGGVLVAPAAELANAEADSAVLVERFYQDRYVSVMRERHPLAKAKWTAAQFASQRHVLVTPRGRTRTSGIDKQLAARGLARRIARIVPTFTLAIPLVVGSDLVVTVPELCLRGLPTRGLVVQEPPLPLPPLSMSLAVHRAHASDPRARFTKALLLASLRADDRRQRRGKSRPQSRPT